MLDSKMQVDDETRVLQHRPNAAPNLFKVRKKEVK